MKIRYERDWTWVEVGKVSKEMYTRIVEMGGRRSRKRKDIYFKRRVEADELVWLDDAVVIEEEVKQSQYLFAIGFGGDEYSAVINDTAYICAETDTCGWQIKYNDGAGFQYLSSIDSFYTKDEMMEYAEAYFAKQGIGIGWEQDVGTEPHVIDPSEPVEVVSADPVPVVQPEPELVVISTPAMTVADIYDKKWYLWVETGGRKGIKRFVQAVNDVELLTFGLARVARLAPVTLAGYGSDLIEKKLKKFNKS